MGLVEKLTRRKLIKPPWFLAECVHYETLMGSVAYGVSSDTSDMDVYGFAVPPKSMLFPHLDGHVPGFGTAPPQFEQFQKHHVDDPESRKVYDITVYSIVKFFQLCMENNPNMIDSLFTPQHCVLHCTAMGQMVRDQRRMFLHKGAWIKFKGYAYSQKGKILSKDKPVGKRKELVEQHGFDIKFAYHLVRLMNEVEQILVEGDLDLERNREQLKSIRRGEWSLQDVLDYFDRKERELETVYLSSKLPEAPDEARIKQLLLDCLEHHYGSLADAVVEPDHAVRALGDIQAILDHVRDKTA